MDVTPLCGAHPQDPVTLGHTPRFVPVPYSDAYYEPNLFGGPRQEPRYAEPLLAFEGEVNHYDHRSGNDGHTQPGNLFRLFDAGQRQRLYENIAAAMRGVPEQIHSRQIALFSKCDEAYGAGVAAALRSESTSA
jgi:catalase